MSKEFCAQSPGALKKKSVHPNCAGAGNILCGIIDKQSSVKNGALRLGRVEASPGER